MIRNYYFLLLIIFPALALSQGNDADIDYSQNLDSKYFEHLIDSSNNHFYEGNYNKSLEVNILLLKQALKQNNNKYIFKGYRNLGYDYMTINDTILATESFNKAEKYAKLNKNDTAQAITYMDLANLYFSFSQDFETAFEYQDKSIRMFKKIKDSSGLAKAHYNAVLASMEGNNLDRAFKHLIIAKKLAEHEGRSSYKVGVEILFGQYYLARKNYELADIFLLRGMDSAKRENLIVETEDAYDLYSQSLFDQERFSEAYKIRLEFEDYYKEKLEKSTSAEVEALSASFQVNEYRKDIVEAELKNKLQTEKVRSKSLLNKILITTTIVTFILLAFLWLAFRKRKHLVTLLREKNVAYLQEKEQSEKLAAAKSNFFSTVSHELRTPLYGVIGLSTILLEDESLKTHEKDLRSLKFSADYLLALINDVLQINKIDSKKIEDSHTPFNLRELLDTITSSLEYMKLQNKNSIEIIMDHRLPELISGNHVRLSQILMNLIGNAVKFTENGTIQVIVTADSVSEKETSIQFKIIDNGIGIAKDKIPTIFDEFSQAASEDYNYQGTGLGLPIVKKLLALSDANIEVESELGQGSCFTFALSYDILKQTPQKENTSIIDVKELEGKRILIVEDNRINQIVTQKILEKNNVNCTIAENGLQAIEQVRRNRYDLVLMDINMPVKGGIEATLDIRAFNSQLPIIALTAVEIEEMRHQIYQAGMNDIIVKPYDVNLFTQTILKNLRQKEDKSHLRAI